MRSLLRAILGLSVVCLTAHTDLAAQSAAPTSAWSTPTCEAQGVRRVALSVPPGRTREDLTASIARGEVFAAGVDTHIFPQGTGPQMINVDHMNERTRGELQRLVRSGTKVDGAIAVLLVINAEGKVVQTTPGTGDRALDQRFDRLWREAEFVPVSIGGCRVVTYFHIPMSFSSDFSYTRNETQMRVGPGAIPSEP